MKKPNDSGGNKVEETDQEILKLNFVLGDVPSLNPHELTLSAHGTALGKCLFEGLTRLNLQGEYELAGAEKVAISPSRTRYVFTLRENYYCDGSPVVAYDYERSWKSAISADSKAIKAHLFYPIKYAEAAKKGEASLEKVGVKALDEKTLSIELEHPTSYFLGLISLPLFFPFKEEKGVVLSNGPYMATERKKDDYSTLEPNPFFWDRERTSIKKIKVFMIKDESTAFALYKNKDIDWIGDPFCWLPADIISSEISKGNLFNETDIIYPFWVFLNTEYFPLSSPLIRRAFSYAVDRSEIAEHIFVGDAPLFAPIPQMTKDPFLNCNLTKSKRLFEEGLQELGLTRATFPTLKLSSCSLKAHRGLAEYLQEKWQENFGIQIELDIQEWGTFYANLAKGDFHIGGYFKASDYNDPLACLELLAPKENISKWEHSEYQKIVKRLKCESDIELRGELLAEAQKILTEEIPIIWLVNRVQYHAYRSDLKGVCFDHRGIPDLRWAYFE